MKILGLLMLILLWAPHSLQAEDLGNLRQACLSCLSGLSGVWFIPFNQRDQINKTDQFRLYDQQGNYRGKLSANPFDPDSTSNQFGRYGSPVSPESLNNQYGAGSPFRPDSPNNPYGRGWKIEGR